MLVGDVEVPYKHPAQDSLKSIFSIDLYAFSDETCCQKQITDNIVKKAIFNMTAMKQCRKMKNGNFRKYQPSQINEIYT